MFGIANVCIFRTARAFNLDCPYAFHTDLVGGLLLICGGRGVRVSGVDKAVEVHERPEKDMDRIPRFGLGNIALGILSSCDALSL